MKNEIQITTGKQTESQRNRARIGLLKVAMRYPIGHKSRNRLLEYVSQSYL